jgi:hypothetical protein
MEDPQNPGGKVMRPEGVACLRSFVRHLGETEQKVGPDGQAIPVDTVSVYAVYHAPLMPYQIQAGWDPFDLRLYNGAFLGDYTAAADGIVKNHPVPPGTRLDCDRPEIHRAENVAQIVANLLQSEVEPLLRRVPPQERAARLAEARLPEAVDHFLRDYPPILDKLYPMPAGMLPKAKEEQLKNLRLEIERCFPTSNPDGEAK